MKEKYRFAVEDFDDSDRVCRFMLFFFLLYQAFKLKASCNNFHIYLIKIKSLAVPGKGLKKLFHGLFIIRMTGSEPRFHGLFLIRITGSGLLLR